MKKILTIILILFTTINIFAQTNKIALAFRINFEKTKKIDYL